MIKVEDYYISPNVGLKKSKCKVCKKEFEYYENNSSGDFCTRECYDFSQRKVDRPTKEELYELIMTESFLKIGKKYGVSDNAVRKWCKSYGLPYKKKDIDILKGERQHGTNSNS